MTEKVVIARYEAVMDGGKTRNGDTVDKRDVVISPPLLNATGLAKYAGEPIPGLREKVYRLTKDTEC